MNENASKTYQEPHIRRPIWIDTSKRQNLAIYAIYSQTQSVIDINTSSNNDFCRSSPKSNDSRR